MSLLWLLVRGLGEWDPGSLVLAEGRTSSSSTQSHLRIGRVHCLSFLSVLTQTVTSQGPVCASAPSIMSFFQEIKNCGQLIVSAVCASWWHALAANACFMRWQAQNQRQTEHLREPQKVTSGSEIVRPGQLSVPSSLLGSGIPKLSSLAIHLFSKYHLPDPGPALGNR